jgi:hypothetical protein
MSKKFWVVVLIFSLLITSGAAAYLYFQLSSKQGVPVPLNPIPPQPQEPLVTPPVEESKIPVEGDSAIVPSDPAGAEPIEISEIPKKDPAKISPPENKTKTSTKVTSGPQTVTVTIQNLNAKKVSIVGEFNKWFRQPLKKEDKNWKINLKLKPGKYNYLLVVDDGTPGSTGKRTKDPNNKLISKDGKFSVLEVKSSGSEN